MEFRETEYWNKRYETEDHFEWLGQSCCEKTIELLNCQIQDKQKAVVLILGCGNSNLSPEMRNDGFENVLSTDISEIVIRNQRKKFPHLKWKVLDMTKMDEIEDSSFDFVIEKATLDAFLSGEKSPWKISDATETLINSSLNEISRILKTGGKFFSITFAQPHFRIPLLAKREFRWNVRVEVLNNQDSFHFYAFIMTKGLTIDPNELNKFKVSSLKEEINENISDSEEEADFILGIST